MSEVLKISIAVSPWYGLWFELPEASRPGGSRVQASLGDFRGLGAGCPSCSSVDLSLGFRVYLDPRTTLCCTPNTAIKDHEGSMSELVFGAWRP